MTSPTDRRHPSRVGSTEPEPLLTAIRGRRHNRRAARDRLRWDRELWDAYLRSDRRASATRAERHDRAHEPSTDARTVDDS